MINKFKDTAILNESLFKWILITSLGIVISATAFINPLVTMLSLCIVAVVVASILNPHIPYYIAIIAMGYASICLRLWGDIRYFFNLPSPLILYSFIIFLIARALGTSKGYTRTEADVPIILLLIFGTISILWSNDRTYGTYNMFVFFIALCLFILTVAHLKSLRMIKWAMIFYIVIAFVNGIVCFYSLISFDTVEEPLFNIGDHVVFYLFNPERLLRGQGFMYPLATGYFLSIAIMLAIAFIYINKGYKRFFLGLLTFFLMVAMTTTLSKGPILATLGGLFVFTIWNAELKKHFIITWILILSLVVIGFALSRVPTNDLDRAVDYTTKTSTRTSKDSASLGSRLKRWKIGTYELYNSYGIGTGSGGFYEDLKPDFNFDNVYMHILVEYGFIGLWFWIWFWITSFRRFINAYKNCLNDIHKKIMQVYISGVVTLLLNQFTSFTQAYLPIWFYLGLGYALSNVIDKEHAKLNNPGGVVCRA